MLIEAVEPDVVAVEVSLRPSDNTGHYDRKLLVTSFN
jgi:hypothetical protein